MKYTINNQPGPIPWGSRKQKRALSSAINAISAWQGETPYMPELGLDPRIQHAPTTKAIPMAIDEAYRNLRAFVPGMEVLEVRAESRDGTLYIEADVEVN